MRYRTLNIKNTLFNIKDRLANNIMCILMTLHSQFTESSMTLMKEMYKQLERTLILIYMELFGIQNKEEILSI